MYYIILGGYVAHSNSRYIIYYKIEKLQNCFRISWVYYSGRYTLTHYTCRLFLYLIYTICIIYIIVVFEINNSKHHKRFLLMYIITVHLYIITCIFRYVTIGTFTSELFTHVNSGGKL